MVTYIQQIVNAQRILHFGCFIFVVCEKTIKLTCRLSGSSFGACNLPDMQSFQRSTTDNRDK